MAESIDDLFDCFEDEAVEENVITEEDSSEQDKVTERFVSVFLNLKNTR